MAATLIPRCVTRSIRAHGKRTRTCSSPSRWRTSTPCGVIFTSAVSSKSAALPSTNVISVCILPSQGEGPSVVPSGAGGLGRWSVPSGHALRPAGRRARCRPYPVYEELRVSSPVTYDAATDHWLVTRHRDVDALLRDRRFGRTYLHAASHEE